MDKFRSILKDTGVEIVGAFLVSIATYNVALYAEFPMTGFAGISLILYRLFRVPLGLSTFLMNVPVIFLCYKLIGKEFLLKSFRCMVINSLILDYLCPLLPVYQGDRMLAALMTSAIGAVGYALIYLQGSSTGGSDFIIMGGKALWPHVNVGRIAFIFDFSVIFITAIIFRDVDGFIYGMIVAYVTTIFIDKYILGRNKGEVAVIVSPKGDGKTIASLIDDLTRRGCTILPAAGGYEQADKDVVIVAGSSKDIYRIEKQLKEQAPETFVIILETKEVQGKGFRISRVAGG